MQRLGAQGMLKSRQMPEAEHAAEGTDPTARMHSGMSGQQRSGGRQLCRHHGKIDCTETLSVCKKPGRAILMNTVSRCMCVLQL